MGLSRCWAMRAGKRRRGPIALGCCCQASARASNRWRRGSHRVRCRRSTSPCTTWWPRPPGTTRPCWLRCAVPCCPQSSGMGRSPTGSSMTPLFPRRASTRWGCAAVLRQLGKQDNCQVAVSLSVANDHASLPVAYRLYLPPAWCEDAARRAKAGIPDEIGFATKTALAVEQLRQALADGVPVGVVLADPAYGNETAFRAAVAELGLRYVLGVQSTTTVWPPGTAPLPPEPKPRRAVAARRPGCNARPARSLFRSRRWP